MDKLPLRVLYREMRSLKSLTPSPKVNLIFSKLVSLALNESNVSDLNSEELVYLQNICAQAEFELEKYWAEKILESKNSKKILLMFPYLGNYKKLTQLEWFSLLSCTNHRSHRVLFVGGGPLPLTSIILVSKYTDKVVILDKDKTAYKLSSQLVRKLGLKEKIEIINKDARYFRGYSQFNVIVVAALAGIDKVEKEKILGKIKSDSKSKTHILARSSWGMRKILYKPLEQDLYKMFTPVVEIRPQNDVVNSVIIFSNE